MTAKQRAALERVLSYVEDGYDEEGMQDESTPIWRDIALLRDMLDPHEPPRDLTDFPF